MQGIIYPFVLANLKIFLMLIFGSYNNKTQFAKDENIYHNYFYFQSISGSFPRCLASQKRWECSTTVSKVIR